MNLRITVWLAFIWLFSFALSCSKPVPSVLSNSDSTPSTTQADGISTDPRADVEKAIRSIVDAKSYRGRKELSSSNGDIQTVEFEYVAPDRTHSTQYSNKADSVRRQTIVIGKDTLVKIGDGPWNKSPLSIGDRLAQFYPKVIAEKITKSKEITFLGTEIIDGNPMKKYRYSYASTLNPGSELFERLWIGAADGLIYQFENEMETIINGQPAHTKSTRKLFDFNVEITIDAPT